MLLISCPEINRGALTAFVFFVLLIRHDPSFAASTLTIGNRSEFDLKIVIFRKNI